MPRPEVSEVPPVTAVAAERAAPTNWPLLLLVAMMPLQNIYLGHVPRLATGINFLNLMVLLSFVWWKLNPSLAVSTRTPLHRPIFGYVTILVLSCFYGVITLGYMGEGHLNSLKDMLIPVLLFFVTVNSVRDRRGIVWVLAASMIPLPYMFHTFRHQLHSVFRWHYDNDLRLVKGTFMELGSNEFAAFFSAYTLVLMALIYHIKVLWVRVVLGFLTVLNLYCLMYSYSRGSWVGFLAGVAVVTWFFNRKLALAAGMAVFLTWSVLLSHFPVSVQERFSTMLGEEQVEEDHSAMSRFELWSIAFDEFKKDPLFGIGYHTFHHVNPFGKDTHNYFVKVLTEQGIVGLSFLALVFWRGFATSRRLYRESDDPLLKALGIGMVGCTAALFVGNMFGDRFSHYPLITYFWVYLALVQRGLLLTGAREGPGDAVAAAPLAPERGHDARSAY
jgi:O-antigen ligase